MSDIRELYDDGNPVEPGGFGTWAGAVTDELEMHVVERATMMRRQDPATWEERVFSTDTVGLPAIAVTIEHGRFVGRGSGGTSGRSNRRSVYQIPDSPGGYSRIRSRWMGSPDNPATTGTIPQRGHAHGLQQIGGRWVAVMAWHDVAFNQPQIFNLGIWESETAPDQVGFLFPPGTLTDQSVVSAAARTTNVVTLTVPTGHGFVKGDIVVTDLADNSYDGTFVLTSVTATTVVYSQVAANAGTSTGFVRLARADLAKTELLKSTAYTASARANGIVTATVAAGSPWRIEDQIAVDGTTDNTFDGVFRITELPSTTQIRWRQPGVADQATGGAGTISSPFPYYVESEWWPGFIRVRAWPGHDRTQAPSWESPWAASATITGLSAPEPDPTAAGGCGLAMAHLSGSGATNPTEIIYDSVTTAALKV
jgi:hypothetical protein